MFGYKPDMWKDFALVLLLHCSQNDEFMIFPMYIDFVGMLSVAATHTMPVNDPAKITSSSAWNEGSKFIVDFGDCDYHHFSQRDMKLGVLFFADALRVYTNDLFGKSAFTTQNAATAKLCFMPNFGFTPVYASSSLTGTCTAQLDSVSLTDYLVSSTFPSMYTPEEWGYAMSHNEQKSDEDAVADFEEESHKKTERQSNPCALDMASYKTAYVAAGSSWWSSTGGVNPLAHPVTRDPICSSEDFFTFGEGSDSDLGGLDGLGEWMTGDFETAMDSKNATTDYYTYDDYYYYGGY
jgi:hypothetical protein